MALIKNIELPTTGQKIDYFRITRLIVDLHEYKLMYTLSGYINADLRHNGKSPVQQYVYAIDLPKDFEYNQLLSLAYNDAKKNQFLFKGALDG